MNQMIGLGVDIVQISRVGELIARHRERFLQRIFLPGEIHYCESKPRTRLFHYAARFAAKEALMKAVSPYIKTVIPFNAIEIKRTTDGLPRIILDKLPAELAPRIAHLTFHLSISHAGNFALAVVTASNPNLPSFT